MSWYVKSIGTKKAVIADVRKQLDSQDHLTSQQIIQRIQAMPDPVPPSPSWDQYTHVRVEGAGHGGAVSNLVIEGLNLAPEPVEEAPQGTSQENQIPPA